MPTPTPLSWPPDPTENGRATPGQRAGVGVFVRGLGATGALVAGKGRRNGRARPRVVRHHSESSSINSPLSTCPSALPVT